MDLDLTIEDLTLCAHALSERTVEVPLGYRFLEIAKLPIEVGNVMSQHKQFNTKYKQISHRIIDKFEKADGVENLDAFAVDYSRLDVLCISSIEHFGMPDYGNTELDDTLGIKFLEKIIKEANTYLFTWGLNCNKTLDEYIFNSNLNWIGYIKYSQTPCVWKKTKDIELLRKIKYGTPFQYANGIIVVSNLI